MLVKFIVKQLRRKFVGLTARSPGSFGLP